MNIRMLTKKSLKVAILAALPFQMTASAESDYPNKAIEFIVPWSPGGDSDILMRIVAKYLSEELGQSIPVINMPGVSGTQGLREASKRKNDGYTISQIHEGLLTGHYSELTEQNWDSFDVVAQMSSSYQFIAVKGDSKWQTYEELIADAKANPETISSGVTLGGVPHLQMAMIEQATGAKFSYVGYEGTAERNRALIGGNVDVISADGGTSKSFVDSGDMRLLVAGSPERSEIAPDVPTFKELGQDIELSVSRGIVVPKGTPVEIINKLSMALEKISTNKDFIQSIENVGGSVSYLNAADYATKLGKIDSIVKKLTEQLVN